MNLGCGRGGSTESLSTAGRTSEGAESTVVGSQTRSGCRDAVCSLLLSWRGPLEEGQRRRTRHSGPIDLTWNFRRPGKAFHEGGYS
jgi:hypothetical protein